MNWHLLNIKETLELTGSRFSGLTAMEAEERMEKYGPNQLAEKKKKPVWLLFLAQFKDVMILILLAAAVVSGIIGDLKDTVVIIIIVILNAIVGFVQEYRAGKAIEALKKMAASFAKVKRNNDWLQIPSSQLVPGDIVKLEAGDIVPADIRITESHALKIEEASLTGESHPAEKNIHEITNEDAAPGDRINIAFKSTLINYGRGTGIVVATGMQTEIGAIAQMLQEKESTTPLQKRLADFGKKLSFAVVGICVIIYLTGYLRGEDPVKMLLTAISVAVAAIPEALPAVITIALALGAKKMVSKNALIRKLPAVETLGSVTFICTDKTGTLTQNKMTVREIYVPDVLPLAVQNLSAKEMLLLSMIKNQDTSTNSSNETLGDPTEIAAVQYAIQQKEYQHQWNELFERVQELPFDSSRKLMTTVHQLGEHLLVITKGAYESVVQNCLENELGELNSIVHRLSKNGMRVLAYAYKILENTQTPVKAEDLEIDLNFCGLIGMIDPPREEAKQAVAECKTAGIVPVMITGDHPLTAKAIATETGILQSNHDRVITGQELLKMDEEDFEREVERIKVYARVSPEQKLQIVKTLQKKNHFVAMTGDGVNDAPALKHANIGVAMGITGTDVSKEAGHMILLDDNFATIVKAVREGRRIFDNIRKFIKYAMTGNSGEIWTIFLAPLIGLPVPLLPIHILWINLVTDGLPGLALAGEPAEDNIMQRKPRHPNESIFAQGMGRHIIWVGLLMGGLCIATQAWAIRVGDPHWQTMVFTTLCFCQMAHVMAIRSDHSFLFKQGIFSNIPLVGAVVLTFVLQLAIIYIPAMQPVFNTAPLTLNELLICIGVSLIVFHAVEAEKFVRTRWAKKTNADTD
jgi:P-type Ca2+ transporter type 2C